MKTNPLGDVRAEQDHAMLDRAFYETPEYRSLLEENTRRIVVGRRGTGKSALFYRLQQHWKSATKTSVITLTPNETEVIGLRHFVGFFGSKQSYLRAACCLAGKIRCHPTKCHPRLQGIPVWDGTSSS